MIYAHTINIYNNFIDNFRYKHKLEQDKKYKLPYLEMHYFRRLNILIDDKVEDVYLSTWNFKIRKIDDKRVSVSILEFPKSYVLIVTHWIGSKWITKVYEQLDHIPDWKEIEEIVKQDF